MVDLKTLDTKSLILDMTTNLSRIGNFALAGNHKKALFFGDELMEYIEELDKRNYDERLRVWVFKTNDIVRKLRKNRYNKKYLADDSFTCGIVLQNRAIHLM